MHKVLDYCRHNFTILTLSVFWLFALLNPVFKKYDYGAEFPMVIVFSVLLIFLVFNELRKKRERAFLEPLFLLIFFGSVVASFYYSYTKTIGFSEVLAFSSMIPLYLIFAYQKDEWVDKFFKVIVAGLFLSIMLGFVLYFFTEEPRMIGPFFNVLDDSNRWPNAFALFLLMCWPIILILAKGKLNFARVIGLSIVFSALLLSYSRGALIMFVGQLILLAIYYFRSIKIKKILLVVVILGLGVGIFFFANYVRAMNHQVIDVEQRATFGNSEGLTSMQERLDFWKGAVQLAAEKPLFGWGPYSFRDAYNGIQKTFLGNSDHPHNIFLKIAAENGLIALGAFLAFLIAVMVTTVKRFPNLGKERKDTVYFLFVAIAGAFAHSVIDYNFNFYANLFLLFVLIAILRSLVIAKSTKERRPVLALFLAIPICIFALYEGVFLVLAHTVDGSFLENSLYPRNYYLSNGEQDFLKGNFTKASKLLQKDLALNKLDSQAFYLNGLLYCSERFTGYDLPTCKQNLQQALQLNPMNEFTYYRDYIKLLQKTDTASENKEIIQKAIDLVSGYFNYVQNNVHFTAYTSNVEVAYDLIKVLMPYLTPEQTKTFKVQGQAMMDTAIKLRGEKTF